VFLGCEAHRDEIFEELVELGYIARCVGCEVAYPLDSPPKRGIRSTLAVDVPPASRFENDERVRRWVLAGEPTRDRLDFVGDIAGLDVILLRVRDVDWYFVDRDVVGTLLLTHRKSPLERV
jgi:hypothetical protein